MRMPIGATSWSLTEEDSGALAQVLQKFLFDSSARCALLVDRSGQLVSYVGDRPTFDVTAFATLTAADFSANDQLARLIGESDFNTLFHQGEKESMLLADVARRVILVALFDNRTTLGLVRLKMRGIVDEVGRLIERSLQRSYERSQARAADAGAPRSAPPSLLGDVDDEIDRLFQ